MEKQSSNVTDITSVEKKQKAILFGKLYKLLKLFKVKQLMNLITTTIFYIVSKKGSDGHS